MIFYTDKFLKDWMGGRQFWFFGIVRPKYRNRQDLIEHEKEHIKQWWVATLLTAVLVFGMFYTNPILPMIEMLAIGISLSVSSHGLLYKFFKKYRLYCEIAAYKVSLKYRPVNVEFYSDILYQKYDLGKSREEIKKLLVK